MTDVIGDAFAKRKVKGLHGLSFASYEMGWLDAKQAAQADARAFKAGLLEALYPNGIKHPQQTEDDWIIDAVKEQADARAFMEGK